MWHSHSFWLPKTPKRCFPSTFTTCFCLRSLRDFSLPRGSTGPSGPLDFRNSSRTYAPQGGLQFLRCSPCPRSVSYFGVVAPSHHSDARIDHGNEAGVPLPGLSFTPICDLVEQGGPHDHMFSPCDRKVIFFITMGYLNHRPVVLPLASEMFECNVAM